MHLSTLYLYLLGVTTVVQSADPSGGWLSYAVYTAPNPTDIITRMAAVMVVPETVRAWCLSLRFAVLANIAWPTSLLPY